VLKNYFVRVSLALLMPAIFLVTMTPSVGAAAERKVITLRCGAGQPYAQGFQFIMSLEDYFCRELEKRVLEKTKNYQVKCKGYYGGSVAKLGEVLESIEAGMLDMGMVTNCFELSKLGLTNFTLWIPFTTDDPAKVIRATMKTFGHFPYFDKLFARYNQRRIGNGFWSQTSYQLITDFPLRTLEDLKGKKIANGNPTLKWLKAWGCTSVKLPYPEAYNSISTGVIDGYSMPANIAMSLKIYEVAPYFTKVDSGANIVGILTMNTNTWNRLPKEVQKIVEEVATDWSWDVYKRNKAQNKKALEIMKKYGTKIYTLPEEERRRWAKVLSEKRIAAEEVASCSAPDSLANKVAHYYVKTLQKDEGVKFLVPPNLDPLK